MGSQHQYSKRCGGHAVTPLSDYVGLDVYAKDGKKLGWVRPTTLERGVEEVDYLIVERLWARATAVPLSVVERTERGLLVPFPTQFVKHAPHVHFHDDELSPEDKQALEDYYLRRAA